VIFKIFSAGFAKNIASLSKESRFHAKNLIACISRAYGSQCFRADSSVKDIDSASGMKKGLRSVAL
jgi:hypothetical protein